MYASILIDTTLNDSFDYLVPDGMEVPVGARVLVPFGTRQTEGFVISLKDKTDVATDKIKAIVRVMDDFAAIKPEMLKILDPICDKFKLRKIDVLRLFVPSSLRGRKGKRKAKNAVIQGLDIKDKNIELTEQQKSVIKKSMSEHKTFVLHGVTGSGKTEVYMNIIEQMLEQGRTAIMLVPEIGLTPQVLGNFRARFGDKVAILHSGLTTGERYDEWYRLHTGEARIAVGARSAVFAPIENIGVIIIDEEHDSSYFAESNPRFHTHKVAKMRCGYWNAKLILGSATPSIDSYQRAKVGEYELLEMKNRVTDKPMPEIEIVDMAAEFRAGHTDIFSRTFLKQLTETIQGGKQSIIFLNRRGFSSHVTCKNCGWSAKCEHCDVSLVYHKEDNMLKCHYCDSRFKMIKTCPKCESTYIKLGATGTQKVVEELQTRFPKVKIFRMDADTVKDKDSLLKILADFTNTPSAILVGTQMLAKGHHFPNVALVGIIDADNSLHFSDYRATERTFALVTQVAGRCGRENDTGHVVLQTFIPTHYVYKLATKYDYLNFFEKELNTRQITKYPPFTTIVRVLVTGEHDDKIKDFLKLMMQDLRTRSGDFVYLGAMKSPLARLDDKFRYQILCRFAVQKEKEMLDFIDDIKSSHKSKNIQVFLEVNPQSLS
ncbi:MAG: primosomal protein N' [Christensenellaceae bacterium]|jgi:primosomal protein N' (replication factor Y)|nr:primosomal protein N' [Christensenellaceae bacterium]